MHPPTGKYLISRQQWHPADTNGSHKASESIKTPVFDGDKLHIPPYHNRRIHCLYWIRPKPAHRERIHTNDGWSVGWMDKSESLFVLTKAVNNYFPWLRHFIIMAFAKGPPCPSWCRKSLLDLTPPVSLQSLSSLCLDTQIMLWLFCVWVCVFKIFC